MEANIHNCVNVLKEAKVIKVKDYVGAWAVIDDMNGYVLLEHNTYGDETCYLVAKAKDFTWKVFKKKGTEEKVILPYFEETYETYGGLEEALEDYDLN